MHEHEQQTAATHSLQTPEDVAFSICLDIGDNRRIKHTNTATLIDSPDIRHILESLASSVMQSACFCAWTEAGLFQSRHTTPSWEFLRHNVVISPLRLCFTPEPLASKFHIKVDYTHSLAPRVPSLQPWRVMKRWKLQQHERFTDPPYLLILEAPRYINQGR